MSISDLPSRPHFPKRAVVTAGMPYGNKGLHFGHIGGVFVPADTFARFLRDRLGEENVLFVSGTDCYGSPIDENYRKLVDAGKFAGDIADYVEMNHDRQVATLRNYDISLDIFEGSGIGKAKMIHEDMTTWIIRKLHENGYLHKLATPQFYDEDAGSFINGRQVVGRCPVPGCKSEHAYADECDLGHQYLPVDLIAPVSVLSGKRPLMRDVVNWYFDLPRFKDLLGDYVCMLQTDGVTRPVVSNTIDEFLVAPIIYVKNENEEQYRAVADKLPVHVYRAAEKGKQSFELEFKNLDDRATARLLLESQGARLRTGKALVPFRITGNIRWGVPAMELEGTSGLTVWCWPESLWAPISFTRTWLETQGEGIESLNPTRRKSENRSWKDFWCDPDAMVYQFIGQDNIYFYGVAQTAMWSALPSDHEPRAQAGAGELRQSQLIANYHLQFLGKKASSSGTVKPPMADDLLNYYTVEQLRAHFLALGLGLKPVSFQPKPLNPSASAKEADPVLKEGQLLTNVFNRLARSCFYGAQKENNGLLPLGIVDEKVVVEARDAILEYERLMHRQELHTLMQQVGDYIRAANKYWSDASKAAEQGAVESRTVLVNTFHMLRIATVLMHPIAPRGTQMIFEYLNLNIDARDYFSWDHIFEGNEIFVPEAERTVHRMKELPPRTDFFRRHSSQFQ